MNSFKSATGKLNLLYQKLDDNILITVRRKTRAIQITNFMQCKSTWQRRQQKLSIEWLTAWVTGTGGIYS